MIVHSEVSTESRRIAAEQVRQICMQNNMRHSIIIEGNELPCNSCGTLFDLDADWGATLVDHSMDRNTYMVRSFCKHCWWIESNMQTDINRAIHINEEKASEERRKRR